MLVHFVGILSLLVKSGTSPMMPLENSSQVMTISKFLIRIAYAASDKRQNQRDSDAVDPFRLFST